MNQIFKETFNKLFWQCLAMGYSTVEARNYASLELTGKLFHPEQEKNV